MNLRVGLGFDNHLLKSKKNNVIKISGIEVSCDYSVIAKSDGDVVFHSLSDALLGALGLGDIGIYFKTNDPKNNNLDSIYILEECLALMKKYKYEIINVDLNIFSEHIEINQIRNLCVEKLQSILKIKNVNIKAKHYERSINEIACQSIVLLKKK